VKSGEIKASGAVESPPVLSPPKDVRRKLTRTLLLDVSESSTPTPKTLACPKP